MVADQLRRRAILQGVSFILLCLSLLALVYGLPYVVAGCIICVVLILLSQAFLFTAVDDSQATAQPSQLTAWELSPDAVICCDEDNKIHYFNDTAARVLEDWISPHADAEAVFKAWHQHTLDPASADQVFKTISASPTMRFTDTLNMRSGQKYERITRPDTRNGWRIWFIRDITHLMQQSESNEHHRSLMEEDAARMTEMAEQLYLAKAELEDKQQELTRLANTDPLTGLANRRHFMQLAKRAIQDGAGAIAIIMCDIDFFKRVNDTYGHGGGDEAIRDMANMLSDLVGAQGFCGRLGGEEFAAFLPEKAADKTVKLAEKLRKMVQNHTTHYGRHSIKFTCSIGVAEWRRTEKTLEPGLDRADRALYSAKEFGRNRVVMFETPEKK